MPEDRGVFAVTNIPWSVLWACNDNAMRVKLTPEAAEKYVTETLFERPSTVPFSEDENPPEQGEGTPWLKILPSLGRHELKAPIVTLQARKDDLEGDFVQAQNDKAVNEALHVIGLNDIESVEWEQVDKEQNTNKIQLGENPAINGGGLRCFPELDAPRGMFHDKINVKVSLATPIPSGMEGSVSLKIFDPDNPLAVDQNDLSVISNTGDQKRPDDNRGHAGFANTGEIVDTIPNFLDPENPHTVRYEGTVFLSGIFAARFVSNESSKTSEIIFCKQVIQTPSASQLNNEFYSVFKYSAHAGDNYIVAAHPNADVLDDVILSTTDGRTLCHKGSPSEASELYPSKPQTKMLTVWRTLWMELDQMATPNYRQGPDYDGFSPSREYSGSALPSAGSPVPGLWATYQIGDEPDDFDLAAQPDKPDITAIKTAMAKACIRAEEIIQSGPDKFPENLWVVDGVPPEVSVPGMLEKPNDLLGQWVSETTFIRNLPSNDNLQLYNVGIPSRDVNYNTDFFWCVQAVGAYEREAGLDWDPPGEGNFVLGDATSYGPAGFLIYNETIRDVVNGGSITIKEIGENGVESTKTHKVTRTMQEVKQLTALHELLHLFGFHDPGDPLYLKSTHDAIMEIDWIYSGTMSQLTTLSDTMINIIQSRGKPRSKLGG